MIPRASHPALRLFLILLILPGVCAIAILRPSFWFDEVHSILMAQYPIGEIWRYTAVDVHPPLYFWYLRIFVVAGEWLGGPFHTLGFLRAASLIPAVLCALCALWLVRRHEGRRAGLWFLALFSASPAITCFAVEIRSYSMTTLFLFIAVAALHEQFHHPAARGRMTAAAASGVAAALALWTHGLAILYLFAMGLIAAMEAWRRRNSIRTLAPGLAISAFALIAGSAPMLPQLLRQGRHFTNVATFWPPYPALADFPTALGWHLMFGPMGWAPSKGFAARSAGVAILIIVSCLLYRSARLERKTGLAPKHRLLLYSFSLVVVPISIEFVVSYLRFSRIFWGSRYALLSAPFWILMVFLLVDRLTRKSRREVVLLALVLLFVALSALEMDYRTVASNDAAQLNADINTSGYPFQSRIFVWNDNRMLPWLSRSPNFEAISFEELQRRAGAGEFQDQRKRAKVFYVVHYWTHRSHPWATDDVQEQARMIAAAGLKSLEVHQHYWPEIHPLGRNDIIRFGSGIERTD